jgi:hypothetical protein
LLGHDHISRIHEISFKAWEVARGNLTTGHKNSGAGVWLAGVGVSMPVSDCWFPCRQSTKASERRLK